MLVQEEKITHGYDEQQQMLEMHRFDNVLMALVNQTLVHLLQDSPLHDQMAAANKFQGWNQQLMLKKADIMAALQQAVADANRWQASGRHAGLPVLHDLVHVQQWVKGMVDDTISVCQEAFGLQW
jgi:hypothetical protein